MKIRTLLFALLSSTLAVTGLPAAEQAAQHEHADHTELGEHMEKIGGAVRRLGRQVSDASKNEDSLKLVATIRSHAEESLNLKPEKTADLPEADRAKFVAAYQQKMKEFIAEVTKLEAALKDGKNEEAAAIAKGFKPLMDDSHKEFRKKKEKKT